MPHPLRKVYGYLKFNNERYFGKMQLSHKAMRIVNLDISVELCHSACTVYVVIINANAKSLFVSTPKYAQISI